MFKIAFEFVTPVPRFCPAKCRHLSASGVNKNLVHIWRGHCGDMDQRRAQLDCELTEIRLDDDLANQEAEATITLKVNELRIVWHL